MRIFSFPSLIAVLALSLSLVESGAQPSTQPLPYPDGLEKPENIQPYAKQGYWPRNTQKTTSAGGSLVSEYAGQMFRGTFVRNIDSFVYQYSSGRGADYRTTYVLPFDTATEWMEGATHSEFALKARTCKRYDANNKVLEELIFAYRDNQWENGARTTYTYTAAGQDSITLAEQWSDPNWLPNWEYTCAYYPDQKLASRTLRLGRGGKTFSNETRTFYNYNAAGQKDTEVFERWDPATSGWKSETRNLLSYDASSNLTRVLQQRFLSPGNWQDVNEARYTYNSSGQCISLSSGYDTHSGWQMMDSTSYTQMDIHGYPEVTTHFEYADPQWLPYERWTRSYMANGDLLTEITERYQDPAVGTGWVNFERKLNFYNSYEQIVRGHLEGWNSVISQWDDFGVDILAHANEWRYYYAPEATGVRNSSRISLPLITPVPASGAIWIMQSFESKQDFDVTITNATGAAVAHWQGSAAGLYKRQFDVSQLAAGVYYVRVSTPEGSSSKAFVVQH